jgi:hypothetical protein
MRPTRSTIAAVAVAALVLFHSGYVAPGPVVAVEPDAPISIECSEGYLCVGDGGLPVPDLEVSGFEDRVIQGRPDDEPEDVSALQAWGFLESEAKAAVSVIHQVDLDSRVTDWGRDEIRAFIFARLLEIAEKPAADRTVQEQVALDKLTELVQEGRIRSAQAAVNEYAEWEGNKCGYLFPVGDDPTGYLDRIDVQAACTLPTNPDFQNPDPPSEEEFTAGGAAVAFGEMAADPDLDRVARETDRAIVFGGSLAAAAVTAAIGATLAATIPAVASAVVAAIGSFANATTSVVLFGQVIVGVPLYPGAAAATGAMAIGGAIAVILFAITTISIEIWELTEELSIPEKLDTALTDAQTKTPNIAAIAQRQAGIGELFMHFLDQTLPDYPERRTGSPPAHHSSDPVFGMELRVPTGAGTFVQVPIADSATIAPVDHEGIAHSAYLSDGWWVDAAAGGTPTYKLRIEYVDWDGREWTAAVAGDTFIHTPIDDPSQATVGDVIRYQAADTGRFQATWKGNHPPALRPMVGGDLDLVEGGTLTFDANATDPDGDDVTVSWLIEPTDANFPIIGENGRSNLDNCYSDPVGAGTGVTFACPWPSAAGQETSYRYGDDGDVHVRVTATDEHGAIDSEVFLLRIASADPAMTLDDPSTFSVSEGAQVTLGGSVTDVGDDAIRVRVDWGDGTHDVVHFPCDWTEFESSDPDFCDGRNLFDPPPPAADPTAFSLTHAYADEPTGTETDYEITVTATDDDGAEDETSASATVTNVAPAVTIACGITEPPPPFSQPCLGFEPDIRFGHPGDPITLNGRFLDPGDDEWTLDVDWGDGTTERFGYPCTIGADGCPFSLTSTIPGFLDVGVFWHLEHAYESGGDFTISATVGDGDGDSGSSGASARIASPPDAPPSVTIATPADGARYVLGESVLADYECSDDVSVDTCTGPVPDGDPIDTSSVGGHTFSVEATDSTSQVASTSTSYRVIYDFARVWPARSPKRWPAGKPALFVFSLDGDRGTDLLERVVWRRADCDGLAAFGVARRAVTGPLLFLPGAELYAVAAETGPRWAGTCRRLVIQLDDGVRRNIGLRFMRLDSASWSREMDVLRDWQRSSPAVEE